MTSKNFQEKQLGEICTFLYGKNLSEPNRISGNIPVYGSNGIIGWHNKPLVNSSCIIIGRKGSVGKIHYSSTPCWPIDTTFYIEENENYDLKFIFYLLKSINLEDMDSDTSVPGLNRNAAHKIEVSIPNKIEQNKISEKLEIFDLKIQNLEEQNSILETIAQKIFESWFIDFEGETEFCNSELGKIPKGWKPKKLATICTTQYGYTESANLKEIGPKFLRITDINKQPWINWKNVPFCKIDKSNFKKYSLNQGDVIVSRMADPGKAGIIEDDIKAVFASYLVRIKMPTIEQSYFIFYFLRSKIYLNYVYGISDNGSTRKNMNARVITGINLAFPNDSKIKLFFKLIYPLRNFIKNNNHQIIKLSNIRDILIPKLISGEIKCE
tara:strand:+ start:951 stop:2096 length:1146 start_codon:yes stop_codon:yes gene_type:complete